jgi:hypothetical protein
MSKVQRNKLHFARVSKDGGGHNRSAPCFETHRGAAEPVGAPSL